MKLAVVIPTVDGRQEHLARCVRAYSTRSEGADLRLFVEPNHETCGIAWNEGADKAVEWGADYLHFTADDIMPGCGWLEPCIATTERGNVPAGIVAWHEARFVCDPATDQPWPYNPLPTDTGGYNRFFEDDTWPDDGEVVLGRSLYASVPFFSAEQWRFAGPSIAAHYGTDKWLSWRARSAGYGVEACHGAIFYHAPSIIGRAWQRFPGWLGVDLFTFDMDITLPLHVEGKLPYRQPHPRRGTPRGREEARAWRVVNVDEVHRPWHREILLPEEGPEFEGDPSEEYVREQEALKQARSGRSWHT